MRNSTVGRLRWFARPHGADIMSVPDGTDMMSGPDGAMPDPGQPGPGQPDAGPEPTAFGAAERQFAAALFSPLFHAVVNQTPLGRNPDAVLDAILASPVAVATSPLFNPALYAARLQSVGIPMAAAGATLAHWVGVGRLLRIVPNDLYDEAHYLETYADVAELDEFGFEHFVVWGIHEGRSPNRRFDAQAYNRLNGTAAGQAPFAHYVAVGAALGVTLPSLAAGAMLPSLTDEVGEYPEAAVEAPELACAVEDVGTAGRHEELRAIFLPWFYRELGEADPKGADSGGVDLEGTGLEGTGLDGRHDDPEAPWQHYLTNGLAAEVPPHPLFDPDLYRRQIDAIPLPPREPDEPLILHWLNVGRAHSVVPTRFFDETYYNAVHPDVVGQKLGFLHYLLNGMAEGRAPTVWFDQRWHAARYGADADYARFLASGLDAGQLPSALVEHVMQTFAPGVPFSRAIHDALVEASSSWQGTVPPASLWLLAALYVPAWDKTGRSPLYGFIACLRAGSPRELPTGSTPAGSMPADLVPADPMPVGPLFDAAVYRKRAAAAGLPPLDPGMNLVLHWLQHGCAARIVPTERFDEAFYRKSNPDIGLTPAWGFAHFVRNGVFEGRVPNGRPAFRLADVPAEADRALPPLFQNWYRIDFPDQADANPAAHALRVNQARLDALLESSALQEAFAAAQAVEPAVGDVAAVVDYLLPPFHARLAVAHAELRRRIPGTRYDTVLCVPWIRTGGADLVAGLLAKALLRIRPGERILVLRTDQPHAERASWLPEAVDVVLMADLTVGLAAAEAQNLLRAVLRGVAARRVFNVNSRLCWTMMRGHGTNLRETLRTYSYMFCWDQTPSGLRTGYPAEFFADTVHLMTAFLTDTAYLRDELTAMYRLPQSVRDRVVPFFTPAQTAVRPVAMARLVAREVAQAASAETEMGQTEVGRTGTAPDMPLVLWAGRLDRQKRFDLVQEIARRMPDVAFRCWGAALLDAPPDLSRLPSNVTMQGSFDHFDDLPLDHARAWLFTAAWEGMPTTVIELAVRGVAIVASAVGGVPELIRPDTGWPIAPDADAAAYVAALREVLDHPDAAADRAEALQRRVGSIYTEAVYDAALARLLDAEEHP